MLVHRVMVHMKSRRFGNTSHTESASKFSSHNVRGPVYEEIELTDKSTNINFSQNVAYECDK